MSSSDSSTDGTTLWFMARMGVFPGLPFAATLGGISIDVALVALILFELLDIGRRIRFVELSMFGDHVV